jgi:hypothetical protein
VDGGVHMSDLVMKVVVTFGTMMVAVPILAVPIAAMTGSYDWHWVLSSEATIAVIFAVMWFVAKALDGVPLDDDKKSGEQNARE